MGRLRLRVAPAGLAERLRDVAASVDPTLHVDEVRTLAEVYREHRFGDNVGAITIAAATGLPIPGILPGAGAFMLLVGVLASLGPARRGLRVDLSAALRAE